MKLILILLCASLCACDYKTDDHIKCDQRGGIWVEPYKTNAMCLKSDAVLWDEDYKRWEPLK